ncbi:glycosyltransferase [Anditalea andensis]|uniref:Glycosyltransferase 2-like domain-containing protein n=1 Tax=Anditalea andensis TaxID=1048983 RepID=A0A074KRM8_9BACT|nr:glycosyltransferase [Anditalea andensis]KEO72591.1 hypothetical protein EL17_17795 [Anditalea andensis]
MKLSIIVPVYNIANYIQACIQSIISSDLKEHEYEVIIVNDGSTDNSLEKIEFFADKYSHIRIVNQENQGLGGARNTGIAQAKGEYIWFVDGDDVVISENISLALAHAFSTNVEILAFDFVPVNEIGELENWIQFKLKGEEHVTQSGPDFYFINFAKSYIWLYFFKRRLFTDQGILFHESIKMEDSEIMPKIMANCETVGYYNHALICYRKREGSITNIKEELARNHFYYSMVKIAESLRDFQKQFPQDSVIFKGIELKRTQINQMLFTNFLYNNYSTKANKYYIDLLREYKILPFSAIKGFSPKMNMKLNLIRKLVNIFPHEARFLYKKCFRG